MTIQKTVLPCLNEETEKIENTYGYIIDLIVNDFFPITITGAENKDDLKKYFIQICNELFDRVWNEYESKNNDKYVYQCGLVD